MICKYSQTKKLVEKQCPQQRVYGSKIRELLCHSLAATIYEWNNAPIICILIAIQCSMLHRQSEKAIGCSEEKTSSRLPEQPSWHNERTKRCIVLHMHSTSWGRFVVSFVVGGCDIDSARCSTRWLIDQVLSSQVEGVNGVRLWCPRHWVSLWCISLCIRSYTVWEK